MGELYLVTGAGGHLGTHIVKTLLGRGETIRALALPGEERYIPAAVETVTGDVRDVSSMEPFFDRRGYERVTLIHCAAIVTIASRPDPAVWDVNVRGTEDILSLARREHIERMVYVSSVHAIPEREKPLPITETGRFSPELVYGQYAKSKAAASQLVLDAAEGGLHAVIAHPSGIIGPGDIRRRNHSVSSLRAMAEGRIPASIGGGYDFVDVRDAAAGIVSCAERGRAGECYILSGEYISVRDMLDAACKAAGRKTPRLTLPAGAARLIAPTAEAAARLFGQSAPLMTPCSVYTLSSNGNFPHEKAARELGYDPRPIRESIRDTVRDFL